MRGSTKYPIAHSPRNNAAAVLLISPDMVPRHRIAQNDTCATHAATAPDPITARLYDRVMLFQPQSFSGREQSQ